MINAATTNIIAACNRAGLTIPAATQKRLDELKTLRRAALEPEPASSPALPASESPRSPVRWCAGSSASEAAFLATP